MTGRTRRCTDELLYLAQRALKAGELSRSDEGLVKGCLFKARRIGAAWEPSPRQRIALERIADVRMGELVRFDL